MDFSDSYLPVVLQALVREGGDVGVYYNLCDGQLF